VKARIKAIGFHGSIEDYVLIDTGATYTLIDRAVKEIGIKLTGKGMKLIVADGHEVDGELAIIDKLVIEGEELPYAHVILIDFPGALKKRLSAMELADWCIIGHTTLELLNLIPNTKTGKLEKVSGLFLYL